MTPVDSSVASVDRWYSDWQSAEHVRFFDGRALLDDRRLVRNFESFNDVRLLRERLAADRKVALLEVGCATGEFYRYLRIQFPKVEYVGIDLSQPAIARAQEKYPLGRFSLVRPQDSIREASDRMGLQGRPEVIYAKDVVHHQTDPLGFLTDLIRNASEMVLVRTRTRDVGPTVWDPERSCQYHYAGWMPYLVMNLQELLDHVRQQAPQAEAMVYRNHMVLGGREGRFLPKECYLPETGTAETAMGIFFNTQHPGRIQVIDRRDPDPVSARPFQIRSALRRWLT